MNMSTCLIMCEYNVNNKLNYHQPETKEKSQKRAL